MRKMMTKNLQINLKLLIWLVSLPLTQFANVALLKPAHQSSVYKSLTWCPMDASKAVDGDKNSDVYACHCSHINDIPGDPNWWAVDLMGVYTMDLVVVYNRVKLPERLNDFWVGFTNVDVNESHPQRGRYPLCAQYSGKMTVGVVGSVKCSYNLPPAKYLIIQMDLNALDGVGMCICEVEAFPLWRFTGGINWKAKTSSKLLGYSYYERSYRRSVIECIVTCLTGSTRCDSFNENIDQKLCVFNLHAYGFNATSIQVVSGWKIWSGTHA